MKLLIYLASILLLGAVFLYTVGFAWSLAKRRNLRGGIGVFLLGLAELALPVYLLFFCRRTQ